jgi:beta,beta-carotene 9',10'-dioxygenase
MTTTTTTFRTTVETPAAAGPRALADANQLALRVPFRGPGSARGSERARLHGRLPPWLRGELVRVAPSFGATPSWAASHWFDALGVVFGFELGGDAVELRWATLGGRVAAAAERGKVPFSSFGSPNQRGLWTRLLQPVPRATDNTNVNVVRMGDEWVALTETETQWALDRKTLQVRERVQYHDGLGRPAMLAHPIASGDTITNLAVRFGRQAEVILFDYQSRSRARQVRGRWRSPELPYLHSFGLTERHAIIVDHPLRVRPAQLLWSNRGFIDHFRWNPAQPARLVLIDLQDGSSHAHETEPLFCFHTVHAFETPSETVLDLIAYPDAEIVGALKLDRMRERFPGTRGALVRLAVDRKSGRVSRRTLSDATFDFPQVDWEHVGHAPEQIVFGAALEPDGARERSRIVRVELESGAARSFSDGDYVFGEPLFVGAPGRTREAEGVLLAVGSSERGAGLFVLDATTLDVLARAEVSTHLPLGFHGNFAAT